MIHYFANHPTAANLLMALLIIAGLACTPQLKRETFPTIDKYEILVQTAYPGASASEVENAVCRRLESATDGIAFLQEKRCDARSHLARMTLKMQEDGDLQQFIDDINSAIDAIDDFPSTVEQTTVTELGRQQPVATIAVSGDLSRPHLKHHAEQLKQQLLSLDNISRVDIQGFSERILQVRISVDKLNHYGLSLPQVADMIRQQGIDLPAGTLEGQQRDYQLRFNDQRHSVNSLYRLVISQQAQGGELRLGDIATIQDTFLRDYPRVDIGSHPAALLQVSKSKESDSLSVLADMRAFIQRHNGQHGLQMQLTDDFASLIQQRLDLLVSNGLQGMLLVFLTMWLFFSWRYAFWIVMGLPVAFLAGFAGLYWAGISINMLSMVALLMALGLLMDDAIVIAESIASQRQRGATPLAAAVQGCQQVANGVLASFMTTVCVFAGLIYLQGDLGQILKVVPMTLLIVISLSLLEAFLILPHHLQTALQHDTHSSRWRQYFEQHFEHWRQCAAQWAGWGIRYRYGFVGAVFALFIVSINLLASGWVKFAAFPDLEGDLLQARILMPQGTPIQHTENTVAHSLAALQKAVIPLQQQEQAPLIQQVIVRYGEHADAFESGPHVVTIGLDLLSVEQRQTSIHTLQKAWREQLGDMPNVLALQLKEPSFGPAGRPIEIRLYGDNLQELSAASHELQQWLWGYPGVVDVMDDLRPGPPEFQFTLKDGAASLGINAQTIAQQLRAAYEGIKVDDVQVGIESYEIQVSLNQENGDNLANFDRLNIIHPANGSRIPLPIVADISSSRSWGRIHRVDNQRAVTVLADVTDANVEQVLQHTQQQFIEPLQSRYPNIQVGYEGEQKNSQVTRQSLQEKFLLGIIGIFCLLALQFRNYVEPIVVMVTIPLALIGVIWGHWLLGLDITMPSMIGFVSLAGVVVNDSILLVSFTKQHRQNGVPLQAAAQQASHDRFRAVILTSLTTIAGLLPLLFETNLQAQVLTPLVVSIVFGILTSTLLVLFVVPALYAILDDFGLSRVASVNNKGKKAANTIS